MIYLTGSVTNHSHVLVTDHAGQHLGYFNGKLVNQIPGAHYVLLTSDQDWKNKLEPILYVPANVAYTITLDGSPLTAPDTESIGIIGPSWHVAVNNIPMHPGDKDTLTVDPNATSLSYHTTRAQSPTIQASVSDTRAHYAFVIAGVSSQPGSTINLSVPAEGGSLNITNMGSTAASTVNLQMTRETEQGVQNFRHDDIPLTGGDTARAPVRQLDQHQPGHPPHHHPQRAVDHPNSDQPVAATAPDCDVRPAVTRLMSIHRSPRLGTADDIAAMVAFLISDDGAWVNGQSLSVEGPFFGIRAVAPGMKAAGGGVIVNVSSSAAFLPSSHIGVYATSKWAVRGVDESGRARPRPRRNPSLLLALPRSTPSDRCFAQRLPWAVAAPGSLVGNECYVTLDPSWSPAKRSSSGRRAPVRSSARMNVSVPKISAKLSSGKRSHHDWSNWLA